jgi:riboflavin kinase / FMN adenylyltransferase
VKEVRQFASLAAVAGQEGPIHLAIGMFDGVHLGHQSVIESAIHSARRRGGRSGVLTFWPHPSVVLRPENPARLMMPAPIRRRLLANLGPDFIIEQPFTRELAATSARDFVAQLKRTLPGLEAIYVGENFRFGRDREGDISLLIAEAKGLGVAVYSAPRLNRNGAPISSTRIRELIADGDLEEANALLGYEYFCEGVVQAGKKLGRALGFPTLNIEWHPELTPRLGVYAVWVVDGSGSVMPGVANYGIRPTVDSMATVPVLEVHVLTETNLKYGDRVTVRWVRFIRPEKKFAGLPELRAQIESDRKRALAALAR